MCQGQSRRPDWDLYGHQAKCRVREGSCIITDRLTIVERILKSEDLQLPGGVA